MTSSEQHAERFTGGSSKQEGRAAQIAVVIPCYRVAPQIAQVIRAIPPVVTQIIVVDDACPEKAGDIAEALNDPRVEVIRHPQNKGVGGATKTGFERALSSGADIIVKLDGDGQMDPAMIPKLIQPLLCGTAAFAKGNRFWHLPSLSQMPPVRRLGNLGLSFLAKMASGHWRILDPTNGYFAIRGDVLRCLDMKKISDDYFLELSLLIELGKWGFRISEVPMASRYGDEHSSLSIGRTLWMFPLKLGLRGLARIGYRHFWYDFTVAAVLLLAGIPLVSWGLAFGLYCWWESIATQIPATAGTVMLAGLPFLLGMNFLLQALTYEVAEHFNHRVSVDPDAPPLQPEETD